MCHPSKAGYPTPTQKAWLEKFVPADQIIAYANKKLKMVDAWDAMIHKHVINAPEHITEIVIMHDDTTPTDESDALFDVMAPLVGCSFDYPKKPDLFRKPHTFNTALCRIQRQVFYIVKPPWFDWYKHPDTGGNVGCNCLAFARKCWQHGLAAGLHTGVCIHGNQERWTTAPDADKIFEKDGPPAGISQSLWKKRFRPRPPSYR